MNAEELFGFIHAHFGVDMLPSEIASHLGVPLADIITIAKRAGLREQGWQPSAVATPVGEFSVARNVRKASIEDAYWQRND